MPFSVTRPVALALLFVACVASAAAAEEIPTVRSSADLDRAVQRMAGPVRKQGFNVGFRGAWLHQFPTDVQGGGRMEVDRLFARVRLGYNPKPEIPLSISIGYRYDGYRFQGGGVFGAGPWDDVHSLRASIPLGAPLGKRWFLFALPVVRTTVESGARWDDGVTWGGFAGVAYKANPRLSIGPGIGILGELEDDVSWFPVLIVEWAITPTLTFKTGEGLGATQGPGLFLEWKPNSCWNLAAGGRWDRNRFRLDDQGVAPGGIGQESGYALLLAAEWAPRRNVNLFASLGTALLGSLRLDDRDGNQLLREDYDPAVFVGLGCSVRF